MKKIRENGNVMMSKLAKILLVFVIAGVTLFSTVTSVKAAPNTIKFGKSTLTKAYMNSMKIATKVLTDGSYIYCLDRTKKTPENITAKLVGENDAGLAYIILNGHARKSITGDKDKDYYITQSAVWWYLDETAGGKNLSTEFKTTVEDPYGLRPYMKKLVEGAKAAKAKGYSETPTLNLSTSNKKMNLSNDKKYYVSEEIVGNAANIDGEYKVSVTSAPKGTIITDVNGTAKTSFAPGAKFLVKVPVENVTETSTKVTVTATAAQTVYKAYEYTTGEAGTQNSTDLYPETTEVKSSITLEIETTKLSIVKLDKDTDKPLPGAKLQLADKDGNVVATWTSTAKSHVIQNLPDGTYNLTELEAPKGYILNKDPIRVQITENKRDVEVKMYNKANQVVINILKVDKTTQKPLAGAVLVVKDKDGKEVEKFTTTEKPYVLLDLENGTYTVEEISAPEGYIKSDEVITFIVDEDHQTHQIIYGNKMICGPGDKYGPNGELCIPDTVEVPNTMTKSGMVTTILGSFVLALASAFVYKHAKKN